MDDGDKLTSIAQGGTTVKSYTYDAAGRTKTVVTSAGTTTLTYDYESRVTGITYPSSATNSFSYNGLDARVGKVDSGGTATYRRDGAGVTASVLSDGGAVYTPGVSQRRGGATTYDLADRLGTATKQTSASTTTTGSRSYDAFGLMVASTGTPLGPFGFAGGHEYQEDGDSGLKLLGHRYYDASTGRFLTRDPARDGRNWYGYCGNNPSARVDAEGLEAGKMYGTAEQAAQDAMTDCGDASKKSSGVGTEYYTNIHEKDNKYYYDPIRDGGETGSESGSGTELRGPGFVHSHGKGSRGKYDDEHLSPQDRDYADFWESPIYAITPKGKRTRYVPVNGPGNGGKGTTEEWDKGKKSWRKVGR